MKKLEHYNNLKSDRQEWNTTLEEAGRHSWPNARTMVKSTHVQDEGQVVTMDIADSTAVKAALRCTSGIVSFVMPVGTKWFDLRPKNEASINNRTVMRLAGIATETTQTEMLRSNFIRDMFTTVRSMVVFGTGCISVEWIDGGLIYRNFHIADIFFDEDSKGRIDTVYRRMFYTVRQAIQEFGIENVSEDIKRKHKAGQLLEKIEIVHCVYPRKDRDPKKVDAKGKKYVSEYVEVANENVLKSGGFNSIPYLIGRFERSPDEIMGRGPGIDLLPDIRMLNNMRYTFVESSEKASNPPLIIEDDGVVGQPGVGPNDLIVIRAGAMEPHALQTGANPQLTFQVIQDERQGIYEGFYNDLFQPMSQNKNMTATEANFRYEEKMVMLAPTIAGLQKELLDPLVTRSMELLIEHKKIEPIGEEVDVAYQGRLSLAMSNMQTNAVELWAAKWSPYQEFYPVLDNVDLDGASVDSALAMGVQAKRVRTQREVDEIRKPTQDAMQMQQQAQLAETGSKAIKNIQGTSIEGML